jgi:parallel beta-helix repeat protein
MGANIIKRPYIVLVFIIIFFIINSSFVSSLNVKNMKYTTDNTKGEKNNGLGNLRLDTDFDSFFVTKELIVKFKEDNNIKIKKDTRGIIQTGLKTIDILNEKFYVNSYQKIFNYNLNSNFDQYYKLELDKDENVLAATREFTRDPNIEYAEPNYIYQLYNVPDDPYFNNQWGLNQPNDFDIDATEAWDIETGDSDVTVAIIDSGVDYNHPDLKDNIWVNENEIPNNRLDDDGNGFIDDVRGWDFVNNDSNPLDDNGHGTHCAGIVGAKGNNGIGVSGVCWDVSIMPVKCFDKSGTSRDAANGIIYASDNGADVISMSWGSYGFSNLLNDVVQYAYSKGVVLVAAAGNSNTNIVHYPSGYEHVISVAASNMTDRKTAFSNYGFSVDVSAPGEKILSTMPTYKVTLNEERNYRQNYEYLGGTSMACPHVAGVAALLLSNNNNLTPDMITTILVNTADKINLRNYYLDGSINAYHALIKKPGVSLLKSLQNWTNVTGVIDIIGKAFGEQFESYTLEWGRGIKPESWIEIVNSNTANENFTHSFDTSGYEDGIYTIRLDVKCNGDEYQDFIRIVVNSKRNIVYVNDYSTSGPANGSVNFPYKYILDGVNDAGIDDTVYVYSGVYSEGFSLDRTINIYGENKGNTTVVGPKNASAISIGANGVNFRNFTIKNINGQSDYAGIYIYLDAQNINISDSIISNYSRGIFFDILCLYNSVFRNTINSGGILFNLANEMNTIKENTILNNEMGIAASFPVGINITNNLVSGHETGIFIIQGMGAFLKHNNVTNNKYGIKLQNVQFNFIYNNNFIDNGRHVLLKNSAYTHFKGNYWDNWIGVKFPRIKLIPKLILCKRFFVIPWINFDLHPAKEPYDI